MNKDEQNCIFCEFAKHIISNCEGDMGNPSGGVRYVIPDLGNYKIPRN